MSINVDQNNSVTPVNTLALRSADGTELEVGMRVEHVVTGQRCVVLRLDKRSRRAVVEFEPNADGTPVQQPTMRQAHLLKVRRNAGKILFMKAATKAAKIKK